MSDEARVRDQVVSAYAAVSIDDGWSERVLGRAEHSIRRRHRRRQVVVAAVALIAVAGIGFGLSVAQRPGRDTLHLAEAVTPAQVVDGYFGDFAGYRVVQGADWLVRVPGGWSADLLTGCISSPALILRSSSESSSPCEIAHGIGDGIRLMAVPSDVTTSTPSTTMGTSNGPAAFETATYGDRRYTLDTIGDLSDVNRDEVMAILDSATVDGADAGSSPQSESDDTSHLSALTSDFVYPKEAGGWHLQRAVSANPENPSSDATILLFVHGSHTGVALCSGEGDDLGYCAPTGDRHTVVIGGDDWECDQNLRCQRSSEVGGLHVGFRVRSLVKVSVLSDLVGQLERRSA